MAKVITDRDVRDQIHIAVGTYSGEDVGIDIDAVTEDIIRDYGLVDIDVVDSAVFWAIVEKHDRS